MHDEDKNKVWPGSPVDFLVRRLMVKWILKQKVITVISDEEEIKIKAPKKLLSKPMISRSMVLNP